MSEEVPFFIKFLVTHKVAGLIIGKAGARISQIQNETNAQVKVNSVTDGVPSDRVVVVAGLQDNIIRGLEFILRDIIDNTPPATAAGGSPSNANNQTDPNQSTTVKLLVPPAAAPGIIGTAGKNIRDIQEQTGAVIRIASRQVLPNGRRNSTTEEEERLVTIAGNYNTILQAIQGIIPFVREFSRAPTEESLRDTLSRSSRLPRMISHVNDFPPSLFRMTTTLEMVVDNADVGAIIGKQGQRITELTNRLGVWMRVSGRSDDHNNPVSQRRVTLTGPVTNLHRAHLEILHAIEIAANARREHANNNNAGGHAATGGRNTGSSSNNNANNNNAGSSASNGSGGNMMVVNSLPMMRGVAPNMIGSYPSNQQTIYLPQN